MLRLRILKLLRFNSQFLYCSPSVRVDAVSGETGTNFSPSASTTLETSPKEEPALEGKTVIVIWSPGFRVFLVQPVLVRVLGAKVSPPQCLTLPWASLASK